MAAKRKTGRRQRSSGTRRRRRLRPLVVLVALATAAALVAWGVAVSGGPGRFWTSADTHDGDALGGHGEVTDAERAKLRELLESIDRGDERTE